MKITKVVLNNFTQHVDVEQTIDENIVGIVGRNGSGKSNFASAISMAVTGEFGRRKKKDLITFGQKKGSIQVEGIIKGSAFDVRRSLHDNDCILTYKDKTYDGADTVNDKLLELLGCDKSFLPNMVFVSQTDILGVLFGRPAERNKMLQKFFGLEKAAKLELLIGQWKSNISYPAIIDEAQSRAAIKSLEEMINQNLLKVAEFEKESASVSKGIEGVDLDKIKENYKEALRKERLLISLNELNTDCIRYRESIEATVRPSFTEKELEDREEELSGMRLSLGAVDNFISILKAAESIDTEKETNCPICDSKLHKTSIDEMLSKLQGAQKASKTLAQSVATLERDIRQRRRAISDYKTEIDTLEGNYKQAMAKIAAIEETLRNDKFPNFSSEVYLDGVRGVEESTAAIKSLESQINSLLGTNNQLSTQIAQHAKDIEAAQRVQSVFKGTKVHESRVSRIRDVFRHDGISGRYVNSQMNNMSASINQYLESFGAEYRVSVGGDNEFLCDFGNKVRPAGDLSCGQKVVLSLAFRFASCETFSTGVDLIVLDEPTTWLDKETIGNFKNIIESISELSDSHNLQVLLVTHERSLMPYFRQTIEF